MSDLINQDDSESGSDGGEHEKLQLQDGIEDVKRMMEKLVLRLEADAYLATRMQSLKENMVALFFKLEDLREKSKDLSRDKRKLRYVWFCHNRN